VTYFDERDNALFARKDGGWEFEIKMYSSPRKYLSNPPFTKGRWGIIDFHGSWVM
jgi:hypothetical protein